MSKRRSMMRLFDNLARADLRVRLLKKQEVYHKFVYSVLSRYQSQWSNKEKVENGLEESKEITHLPLRHEVDRSSHVESLPSKTSSLSDISCNKWKLELDWFPKALEPALQLCRWALPTGQGMGGSPPPSSRSFTEILSSIQRSKIGLQDWSLSDLTLGLYLIYLQQASRNPVEDVKGELIYSDSIVQDLIYHIELAKGAYKDNPTVLARHCMLRESNVVKFVKSSSILRPGYYIGIDKRKKLVVFGIRGTHTVYDLITDIVSSSDEDLTIEGYSTHFGTAEAARWFLIHEMETIRKCLLKHEGFRLRLVGHSLGGAIASLLAIMLRKKSSKELGFNPEIVSAIGYATPPCVSKELAESCSDYITTVVMQDDIIPRLSVASLRRLRNEILQTDWASVLEKEDWKGVVDLVANAKQVVSSVQVVARKLADYAKLNGQGKSSVPIVANQSPTSARADKNAALKKLEEGFKTGEELFVPGTLYYLKRNVDTESNGQPVDYFTLLRRHPGEHFQRILLSSNLISDHKCDSHYYALRDVLKGLPGPSEEDNSR